MSTPRRLLEQNRAWRERTQEESPEIFKTLRHGQQPEVMWIGCADSRVPPSRIVDCAPGELFVHRNVANLVRDSDPNGMSVVQYAVDELDVSHIIVCGHTWCGGVRAVLSEATDGRLDEWLQPLQADLEDVLGSDTFARLDGQELWDRCCEANVKAQVRTLTRSALVRRAWERGQSLTVHGWIYSLDNGRLRDLGVSVDSATFDRS